MKDLQNDKFIFSAIIIVEITRKKFLVVLVTLCPIL